MDSEEEKNLEIVTDKSDDEQRKDIIKNEDCDDELLELIKKKENLEKELIKVEIKNTINESLSEDYEQCPICLIPFNDQDVGAPNNCDHSFCLECIIEWAKNVTTCPIDRIPFEIIYARHSFEGTIYKKIKVKTKKPEVQEIEITTVCEICGRGDREDVLLLCDHCDNGYHMDCTEPPLERIPMGEWYCPECHQQGYIENSSSDSEELNETEDISASTSTVINKQENIGDTNNRSSKSSYNAKNIIIKRKTTSEEIDDNDITVRSPRRGLIGGNMGVRNFRRTAIVPRTRASERVRARIIKNRMNPPNPTTTTRLNSDEEDLSSPPTTPDNDARRNARNSTATDEDQIVNQLLCALQERRKKAAQKSKLKTRKKRSRGAALSPSSKHVRSRLSSKTVNHNNMKVLKRRFSKHGRLLNNSRRKNHKRLISCSRRKKKKKAKLKKYKRSIALAKQRTRKINRSCKSTTAAPTAHATQPVKLSSLSPVKSHGGKFKRHKSSRPFNPDAPSMDSVAITRRPLSPLFSPSPSRSPSPKTKPYIENHRLTRPMGSRRIVTVLPSGIDVTNPSLLVVASTKYRKEAAASPTMKSSITIPQPKQQNPQENTYGSSAKGGGMLGQIMEDQRKLLNIKPISPYELEPCSNDTSSKRNNRRRTVTIKPDGSLNFSYHEDANPSRQSHRRLSSPLSSYTKEDKEISTNRNLQGIKKDPNDEKNTISARHLKSHESNNDIKTSLSTSHQHKSSSPLKSSNNVDIVSDHKNKRIHKSSKKRESNGSHQHNIISKNKENSLENNNNGRDKKSAINDDLKSSNFFLPNDNSKKTHYRTQKKPLDSQSITNNNSKNIKHGRPLNYHHHQHHPSDEYFDETVKKSSALSIINKKTNNNNYRIKSIASQAFDNEGEITKVNSFSSDNNNNLTSSSIRSQPVARRAPNFYHVHNNDPSSGEEISSGHFKNSVRSRLKNLSAGTSTEDSCFGGNHHKAADDGEITNNNKRRHRNSDNNDSSHQFSDSMLLSIPEKYKRKSSAGTNINRLENKSPPVSVMKNSDKLRGGGEGGGGTSGRIREVSLLSSSESLRIVKKHHSPASSTHSDSGDSRRGRRQNRQHGHRHHNRLSSLSPEDGVRYNSAARRGRSSSGGGGTRNRRRDDNYSPNPKKRSVKIIRLASLESTDSSDKDRSSFRRKRKATAGSVSRSASSKSSSSGSSSSTTGSIPKLAAARTTSPASTTRSNVKQYPTTENSHPILPLPSDKNDDNNNNDKNDIEVINEIPKNFAPAVMMEIIDLEDEEEKGGGCDLGGETFSRPAGLPPPLPPEPDTGKKIVPGKDDQLLPLLLPPIPYDPFDPTPVSPTPTTGGENYYDSFQGGEDEGATTASTLTTPSLAPPPLPFFVRASNKTTPVQPPNTFFLMPPPPLPDFINLISTTAANNHVTSLVNPFTKKSSPTAVLTLPRLPDFLVRAAAAKIQNENDNNTSTREQQQKQLNLPISKKNDGGDGKSIIMPPSIPLPPPTSSPVLISKTFSTHDIASAAAKSIVSFAFSAPSRKYLFPIIVSTGTTNSVSSQSKFLESVTAAVTATVNTTSSTTTSLLPVLPCKFSIPSMTKRLNLSSNNVIFDEDNSRPNNFESKGLFIPSPHSSGNQRINNVVVGPTDSSRDEIITHSSSSSSKIIIPPPTSHDLIGSGSNKIVAAGNKQTFPSIVTIEKKIESIAKDILRHPPSSATQRKSSSSTILPPSVPTKELASSNHHQLLPHKSNKKNDTKKTGKSKDGEDDIDTSIQAKKTNLLSDNNNNNNKKISMTPTKHNKDKEEEVGFASKNKASGISAKDSSKSAKTKRTGTDVKRTSVEKSRVKTNTDNNQNQHKNDKKISSLHRSKKDKDPKEKLPPPGSSGGGDGGGGSKKSKTISSSHRTAGANLDIPWESGTNTSRSGLGDTVKLKKTMKDVTDKKNQSSTKKDSHSNKFHEHKSLKPDKNSSGKGDDNTGRSKVVITTSTTADDHRNKKGGTTDDRHQLHKNYDGKRHGHHRGLIVEPAKQQAPLPAKKRKTIRLVDSSDVEIIDENWTNESNSPISSLSSSSVNLLSTEPQPLQQKNQLLQNEMLNADKKSSGSTHHHPSSMTLISLLEKHKVPLTLAELEYRRLKSDEMINKEDAPLPSNNNNNQNNLQINSITSQQQQPLQQGGGITNETFSGTNHNVIKNVSRTFGAQDANHGHQHPPKRAANNRAITNPTRPEQLVPQPPLSPDHEVIQRQREIERELSGAVCSVKENLATKVNRMNDTLRYDGTSFPPFHPLSQRPPVSSKLPQGTHPMGGGTSGNQYGGIATSPLTESLSQDIELPTSTTTNNRHVTNPSLFLSSAASKDLKRKEKFFQKLNHQQRVAEEVKVALKPFYNKGEIDKQQYKEIMKRAVTKICKSKSGKINPIKILALVEAYVKIYKKSLKQNDHLK